MPMWSKLHQELKIPSCHTVGDDWALSGLKYWILVDAEPTWAKLAMALYTSTLDDALQKMRQLNFLPAIGSYNSTLK